MILRQKKSWLLVLPSYARNLMTHAVTDSNTHMHIETGIV